MATEENKRLKDQHTMQQTETLEMLECQKEQMMELEPALEAAQSSSRVEELTSKLE